MRAASSGEGRASGVVNAVLRRFVAQRARVVSRGRCRSARSGMRIRAGWSTRWSRPGADRAAQILDGQQPASAHGAAGRSGAAARRGFPALAGARIGRDARAVDWNRDAVVLERPVAVQVAARVRSRRRVGTGRRRAARRAAARCAAPACACSMPARRRAARRCTSRNARPRSPSSSRSMTMRCAWRACAKISSARGRDALLVTADLRTRPPSLAPGIFRSRAGGCALFGHRRDPPPSRHQAAAPAERHRIVRGHPAEDSRHRFRTTEARRPSDLLHLLGDAGGERRRWSPPSCAAEPRAALAGVARRSRRGRRDCSIGRSAGSCCPVAARAPMASTMPASLSYPDNEP